MGSEPFNRSEGLLTVEKLKQRHLLGVILTTDDGEEFPDEHFQFCINSAISILEHDLDIIITPTPKVDNVDHYSPNYNNWNHVQLDFYPVASVEKWEVVFPANNTLFEYPPTWFKLDADKGILELFPDQGTIPLWMVNGTYLPQLMLGYQRIPHFNKISYTAGFPADGVPYILNDVIGMIAAMLPLDVAGDLIAGAGIAATSIGLDGLSQSISTTASAMNHGYSAKITSFERRLKRYMEILRNRYKGIIFSSI